jgi:hypothetical protein
MMKINDYKSMIGKFNEYLTFNKPRNIRNKARNSTSPTDE